MQIELKHFALLSPYELYEILDLRIEVFIVEQQCLYNDADYKDQSCFHVLCRNEEHVLIAYARIVPPGTSYPNYSSIGRVVTNPKFRSKGLGKQLMQYCIQACKEKYPDSPIKISAQSYLIKFYTDLGFTSTGEEYLEDGIPHTAMIYQIKQYNN